MNKHDSLRAAIVALAPDLARDPDNLRMWIDKGKVRCTQTPSLNFFYEYKLSVLLVDFTGHPSVVCLAINEWLRANQPDLLRPDREAGYTFEADIVDSRTFDLLFELDLTETAIVTPRQGGGWNIDHPGEPVPLLPDDLPLAGGATLQQGWVPGAELVPDPQ